MFYGASAFNTDIGLWNVENVTVFSGVFKDAVLFNQGIGEWNVGDALRMDEMFHGAASFDQNLATWQVLKAMKMDDMLSGSGLSKANYELLLIGWSQQEVKPNLSLGATGLTYCNATENRQQLINDKGWVITGDVIDCTDENNITFYSLPTKNTLDLPFPISASINNGLQISFSSADPNVATIENNTVTITGEGNTVITATQVGGNAFAEATSVQQTLTVNLYKPFISVWKTDNPGLTGNNQIKINAIGNDFEIVWEEVDNEQNNNGNTLGNGFTEVTFPSPGTYRLYISGDMSGIYYNSFSFWLEDYSKILDVEQWGDIKWTTMRFDNCINFNPSVTDVPDLSQVESMIRTFAECSSFNANISNWDVSNVTDMSWMFKEATSFNQDINSWDVSNVSYTESMFEGATSFNQPLNKWDVRSVGSFHKMFKNASDFNQDIGDWGISNSASLSNTAGSMSNMFENAISFNQDISGWDIYRRRYMNNMLNNTAMSTENYDLLLQAWSEFDIYDQEIGVLGLTYCAGADARTAMIRKRWSFYGDELESEACASYTDPADGPFITIWKTNIDNQNTLANRQIIFPGIGEYNIEWEEVGNEELNNSEGSTPETNFTAITFPVAGIYRIKISGNLTRVNFHSNYSDRRKIIDIEQWGNITWTSMEKAFYGTYNLHLTATDAPDLTNVTSLHQMFTSCRSLNGYVGHWDVSTISDMGMFQGSFNFNQDITGWNVSNVTAMNSMFSGSNHNSNMAFNQDIGNWNIAKLENTENMFSFAINFNGNIDQWTNKTSNITSM